MAAIADREMTVGDAKRAAVKAEFADRANRVGVLVILFLGAVLFLIPFYVMLTIALKSKSEMEVTNIWAWPQRPTLENLQYVIENPNVPFGRLLQNTFTISVVSTLGVLFSSSLVAYAFARLNFAGRDRLFVLLLSTMMLPGIVTMIPTYVLYSKIGWVNTFLPLTVPAWFGGGAYNIFLLRQFMLGIPRDLDEAAFLDGAGYWTIFWRVIMPNSGAGLATVGIFSFIWSWKDLMGPLLYLNDPELQTNELGLSTYNALQASQWEKITAGSVIVMVPLMVLFLVGQRYFVKVNILSGIK